MISCNKLYLIGKIVIKELLDKQLLILHVQFLIEEIEFTVMKVNCRCGGAADNHIPKKLGMVVILFYSFNTSLL